MNEYYDDDGEIGFMSAMLSGLPDAQVELMAGRALAEALERFGERDGYVPSWQLIRKVREAAECVERFGNPDEWSLADEADEFVRLAFEQMPSELQCKYIAAAYEQVLHVGQEAVA